MNEMKPFEKVNSKESTLRHHCKVTLLSFTEIDRVFMVASYNTLMRYGGRRVQMDDSRKIKETVVCRDTRSLIT